MGDRRGGSGRGWRDEDNGEGAWVMGDGGGAGGRGDGPC